MSEETYRPQLTDGEVRPFNRLEAAKGPLSNELVFL